MEDSKKKFLGWRMVILAVLITTFAGNFGSNASGVANTLMMASPDNQVSQVIYGMGWTITSIVAAIGGLVMGTLNDKVGPKKLFMAGSILAILSGFVLVQFQAGSSLMFLLNYGFVLALSFQCVSFVTTQSIVSNWLLKRRGTGGAIVNTGTVFAGMVTAPLVTWLINSVAGGNWKYGYYFFGAASVVGLVLSFFIINKPSDVGQYPDGVDPAEVKTEEKNSADKDGRKATVYKNAYIENHYTYTAALHTPLFWGLVLLHTLTLCLSNYIMNPGSLLFVQAGFTMETVSTVLSARQLIRLAFLAFLMRYIDRIEPVKLITFTCGLAAVCYAVSADPTSYWQILAFYAGGSIVMSAQMAIPGVMLANIYGTTSFGKIYSCRSHWISVYETIEKRKNGVKQMKIANVETIPVNIPFANGSINWKSGHMPGANNVIVKITADDGTYGVGEATPRTGIYGETQESIYYVIKNVLGPMLIGEDSFHIQRIMEKMDFVVWNPTAKGAIDIALYDLNGRLCGLPICKMLGGPYRKEIPLSWTMAGTYGDYKDQVDEVIRKTAEGYRSFKIKTGNGDIDEDIRLLKEMKENCPEGTNLYIDVNMAYSREEAFQVLHELEGVISCVEEPLPATDNEGRVELAKAVPIPILSDESTITVNDVYRQIQLGAVSRIGIKLPRTGITLSAKIIHLAESANLPCQISTQLESDLGTATCVQLAAAFKQISLPCEISGRVQEYGTYGITDRNSIFRSAGIELWHESRVRKVSFG